MHFGDVGPYRRISWDANMPHYQLAYLDLLGVLLGLHFLADYPLQGPYLSALKNSRGEDARWLGPRPWVHGLVSHSAIHGLFVGLATGSLSLALAETVMHGMIDYMKSQRVYGPIVDQLLHFICKVWWAVIALWILHTQSPLVR